MHAVFDHLLVGLALLASVIYAGFALGPRTLRRRLLLRASARLRRLSRFPRLQQMGLRLQTAATIKGSCGGCDDCGSGQLPNAPAGGADVGIPAARIGRRERL